ncbi:hypothetical protein T4B_9622 [Trichinella pseudospiralis]|uniref:Uncharacterized protein n=2 Tax=Trichinella pseudospiralis TaxID=6337 RepID=A0A0V1IDS3_TRIPS|nr:hypothetical protein T4D_9855 [Trichinella pseudospiralis]KRZ20947.1 hypothetical protein T4B_9622 [Trichinella pseudospiralis]
MQCLRLYRLIFSIRNGCSFALLLRMLWCGAKFDKQFYQSVRPTSTVQTSEFVYRCAGSGQLCYILSSALNWLDRNPTTICCRLRYTTTRYATLDDVNVIDHRKPLLLGLVICSVNNER